MSAVGGYGGMELSCLNQRARIRLQNQPKQAKEQFITEREEMGEIRISVRCLDHSQ